MFQWQADQTDQADSSITTTDKESAVFPGAALKQQIDRLNRKHLDNLKAQKTSDTSRIGGGLAVHCRVNLEQRKVLEAAAMATPHRGYEALLPGRDLKQIGLISATASGICGGVHATASALCLEMALGIKPPPLGIVLRNLLLSCQYLNDNTMHLFVLAGPDYSQEVFATTNPAVLQRAQSYHCRHSAVHGYRYISEIMRDLNKGSGKLYKEALRMVSLARNAYILLGGKYPHSESIIPGGVSITSDGEKLKTFRELLAPFAAYSEKTAAIWDDLFDFLYDVEPRYQQVGQSAPAMLDFGQWDHPEYYDATYENCDAWGRKRWSTPALILDGQLICGDLSLLNAGLEEDLSYSYHSRASVGTDTNTGANTDTNSSQLITCDPLGNPISPNHPWNKRLHGSVKPKPTAYSWGSSLTWRGLGFEVGAYSRLYLTAKANLLPDSQYLTATGHSMQFHLAATKANTNNTPLEWVIPAIWNAFERNRARAYCLAFSYTVTLENIDLALAYLRSGETLTHRSTSDTKSGRQLGVGLWGASRGFLAHWAVVEDKVVNNYQISIPSRVNVGTRTANNEPGPLEKALTESPIIETFQAPATPFTAIDIQRIIQSFDPCMSCSAHVLVDNDGSTLEKVIDTCFPI